jgi:hypothetical protein
MPWHKRVNRGPQSDDNRVGLHFWPFADRKEPALASSAHSERSSPLDDHAMPQPPPSTLRFIRPASALALVCGLALGAMGGSAVQWQLEANVPVICTILEVDRATDRPTSLVIATSCNAERYQLVLHHGKGQIRLRSARSSAGTVQISGGTITITSTRPGYALTTIDLTAPASPETASITLQPI